MLACWPAEVLKMLPSNHAAQNQLHRNCLHAYKKGTSQLVQLVQYALFHLLGICSEQFVLSSTTQCDNISTSILGSWTSSDYTFPLLLRVPCTCFFPIYTKVKSKKREKRSNQEQKILMKTKILTKTRKRITQRKQEQQNQPKRTGK